ncbi:ATP-binding protein [Treponema zioleckii]|uniref:ATP-binding protein n=1 Tax=Treponema zioleckii TaxID=331680 RepID=UPI001F5B364A|nr:ATP-binding protein [Treponema zioleckii]
MKKKDVLNLIKCYSENNDAGFRAQAYQIAKEFDSEGDVQLSEYILSLLSGLNTFVPQMLEGKSDFFKKIIPTQEPLPLPEVIKDDLIGLVNAVGHNIGINKFLFHGAPGTGKTESAKQVARLLERELYSVDFDSIIDSKLGQTSKNIATVFDELNNLSHPEKVVILFDEIDAIALDRTNTNDLREMGRATSSILKGFDTLNEKIVLIATTNLFSNFDKALSRRFDTIIDFNRYTNDDLLEIADIILDYYLPKIKGAGKNKKLFRKIMALMPKLPYPGELKNLIKTSLAFSTIGEEFDYLVKLYKNITGKNQIT